MRIYYIFNIKKEIFEVYKDTPSVLYNFFYQFYYKKKDFQLSNVIFRQISNKYNKEYLDLKIYIKMHNKMRYSKRNEDHIINDIFKNEISIMKIKRGHIIINSNNKMTEFFDIINYFYKYLLVCDFNNQEFFYLRDIKMLV